MDIVQRCFIVTTTTGFIVLVVSAIMLAIR